MTFPSPLGIGIIGTGFVAQRRAEAIRQDDRAQLIAVSGRTPARIAAFCETYQNLYQEDWQALIRDRAIDVIVVCSVNSFRTEPIRAALNAGKHVVTEYPLCLDPDEAAALIQLARDRDLLLHVEHIELLGGLHQALLTHLPHIGAVHYARYITLTPQRPVAPRWSYHYDDFGFPLSGALSRIHRFTDAFGKVNTVYCQARFWQDRDRYYRACLCNAQLGFASGAIADIIYGKGDRFWRSERTLEIHGDEGTLSFSAQEGQLIRGEVVTPIAFPPRRGLFARDTQAVFDYLLHQTPLYVTPEASLYSLRVAEAARQSARSHQAINL
ncbi:MAG: Gfo/Idh/MocA family oxidoreductase [Jaaginema sp. PMC 1079.18]|nr:Gfo/Idh/MocA family oxidoreductase [Jaaginema sp. PMC 1080.18]MEC4851889.1 Gfo/Idh/MocA family oxidoreductase [Jaaginema sp. PMC 1079.18]MEC4866473.1 Gfo/Idh/MocA family oxidoreductase [Jaaginema sp. PMC 1078.18]